MVPESYARREPLQRLHQLGRVQGAPLSLPHRALWHLRRSGGSCCGVRAVEDDLPLYVLCFRNAWNKVLARIKQLPTQAKVD